MKRILVTLGFIGLSVMANAQSVKRSIYFNSGSSVLSSHSTATLDSFCSHLASAKNYDLLIIGYTDSVGNETFNKVLSSQRTDAVRQYLTYKSADPAQMKTYFYGENRPANDNGDENKRKINRRVDIIFVPVAVKQIAKQEPSKDYTKWPYVRTAEKGTIVKISDCTFSPYKPEEVEIKVEEVLDKNEMLNKRTTTVDANGNCLISGGMIYLKCYVNGKPIQPNKNCGMEISMPTPDFDPEMKMYTSANSAKKDAVWNETKVKPNPTKLDGKTYYTFNSNTSGGINMDKVTGPVATAVVAPFALLSMIRELFVHPNTTIKIKGLEEYFASNKAEVLLTFNGQTTIVKATRLRKNIYRLRCNCLNSNIANAVLLVRLPDRERMLVANFTRADYSRLRNLTIFKANDFKAKDPEELNTSVSMR